MPFKDLPEGNTHHDKDACYKCLMCGDHFFRKKGNAYRYMVYHSGKREK